MTRRSKREAFRKSCLSNRLLCALDVVRDASELEGLVVHIPDAVAGHWRAVSRLSDAAGVDQRRPFEREGVDAVLVRNLAVVLAKDPGHVSVPVEADTAVDEVEVGGSDCGVEHVLVDVVAGAGVDQQYLVLDVAVGQPSQPVQSLVSEHVYSPTHNGRGVVVEPFEDFGIRAGPIVIADERHPAALDQLVDASLRVSAISDDVAQAQGFIDLWAVLENRLESLPVGVDIREDRYLQAGFS